MSKKHVHKYHKVSLTFGQVWACALPTCSHYMPNHLAATVPGKMSICWKCDKEFVLDEMNMKNDKPVCSNCSEITPELSDFLDRIGVK